MANAGTEFQSESENETDAETWPNPVKSDCSNRIQSEPGTSQTDLIVRGRLSVQFDGKQPTSPAPYSQPNLLRVIQAHGHPQDAHTGRTGHVVHTNQRPQRPTTHATQFSQPSRYHAPYLNWPSESDIVAQAAESLDK